jgi:CheY-like chemotaxis protein
MKKHNPTPAVNVTTVPLSEIPASVLENASVISPKKGARSTRNRSPRSEVAQKRLKVLIIDDDTALANASSGVLDLFGYECYAVYNPADAIASAESFQPDVVLSDVMMPGVNGVELCMQLKQMLPQCRILLLSGEVSTAHTLMHDAGKQGYSFELIAKPVRPQELVAKFENLFGGTYSPATFRPGKAHRSATAARP